MMIIVFDIRNLPPPSPPLPPPPSASNARLQRTAQTVVILLSRMISCDRLVERVTENKIEQQFYAQQE